MGWRAPRQYWLATLSTAIVTRDMQTSFSCSLLMRTSQTCRVLPRLTGRAVP